MCSKKSYFNIFNDKYLLWRTIQYFNEKIIYPKTALHCAVIKGCLEIVKLLLTYKGIDIIAKDKISFLIIFHKVSIPNFMIIEDFYEIRQLI